MCNFNTSYVSVQVKKLKIQKSTLVFQYIVCVGSSFCNKFISYLLHCISIHRMCRFKVKKTKISNSKLDISIHRMCRFKDTNSASACLITLFQYIVCVGSSWTYFGNGSNQVLFQYIVCVGSRLFKKIFQQLHIHFNTSYVSVQVSTCSSNLLFTCISIHRMCRFKGSSRS